MSAKINKTQLEIRRIIEGVNFKKSGKSAPILYFGSIELAGPLNNSTFMVSFKSGAHTYLSKWPQWAYNAALAAITHDKRVWVSATGEPRGPNLRYVFLQK